MAPPDRSGKDEDLGDVYELLGVGEDVGDKEVQAAFRKGSLKCHPDRHPDDPEAAEKFDRLSRAKELLLDAARRAEYDRRRKAKRELHERFAQEDERRRKLREKLESSEAAAAARVADASAASEAAVARKHYMTADLASRMRAKEAELAERHAGVAAEVSAATAKARSEAEESLVRVRWRHAPSTTGCIVTGATERAEIIKKALGDFDVRTIALESELEAVVQLGSRQDALRAVLYCRERRHQLGFRVSIEDKANQKVKASAPWQAEPAAAPAQKRPRAGMEASAPPGAPAPGNGGFDDWEAKMLADLAGLAAAQHKSRTAAAT